jgi:hypothetical protein
MYLCTEIDAVGGREALGGSGRYQHPLGHRNTCLDRTVYGMLQGRPPAECPRIDEEGQGRSSLREELGVRVKI